MDELSIVKRIKSIRLERKFTLQKMADLTGLTKSYLSMIESGKKSPPIATLSKIANALSVDIATFFEQGNPEDRIIVVRKDQGEVVARDGTSFGYRYESIAPTKKRKCMEPFVITHPPGTLGGVFDHQGEELLYVLEGEIHFFYGDKEFMLSQGDSIYFDSSIPHRGDAVGDKPAKTLVVISQPRYS
jgi:transcriptional regulator with XRE-family HTH domain